MGCLGVWGSWLRTLTLFSGFNSAGSPHLTAPECPGRPSCTWTSLGGGPGAEPPAGPRRPSSVRPVARCPWLGLGSGCTAPCRDRHFPSLVRGARCARAAGGSCVPSTGHLPPPGGSWAQIPRDPGRLRSSLSPGAPAPVTTPGGHVAVGSPLGSVHGDLNFMVCTAGKITCCFLGRLQSRQATRETRPSSCTQEVTSGVSASS